MSNGRWISSWSAGSRRLGRNHGMVAAQVPERRAAHSWQMRGNGWLIAVNRGEWRGLGSRRATLGACEAHRSQQRPHPGAPQPKPRQLPNHTAPNEIKLVQPLRFREATAPAGSTNFQIAMKRYSFAAPFVPVFAYRVSASSARCLDISQPAPTIATPKISKPQTPMVFSDRKLAADPTPTMSP